MCEISILLNPQLLVLNVARWNIRIRRFLCRLPHCYQVVPLFHRFLVAAYLALPDFVHLYKRRQVDPLAGKYRVARIERRQLIDKVPAERFACRRNMCLIILLDHAHYCKRAHLAQDVGVYPPGTLSHYYKAKAEFAPFACNFGSKIFRVRFLFLWYKDMRFFYHNQNGSREPSRRLTGSLLLSGSLFPVV